MQRIFDDERRRNGGFSPGPFGVGPQAPLNVSKMPESGLALPCAFLLFRNNFGHQRILNPLVSTDPR